MTTETRYVVARKAKGGWWEYMRWGKEATEWTPDISLAALRWSREGAEQWAAIEEATMLPVTLTVGEPASAGNIGGFACVKEISRAEAEQIYGRPGGEPDAQAVEREAAQQALVDEAQAMGLYDVSMRTPDAQA